MIIVGAEYVSSIWCYLILELLVLTYSLSSAMDNYLSLSRYLRRPSFVISSLLDYVQFTSV